MTPNEYTNWDVEDLSNLVRDRCAELAEGEMPLVHQLLSVCQELKRKNSLEDRGREEEQRLTLRKAFSPILALWTEIQVIPVVGLNSASIVPLRHRVFLGGGTATDKSPYLRFLGDQNFEVGVVYPHELATVRAGAPLYTQYGEGERMRRTPAEAIECILAYVVEYWRPEATIDL